MKKLYAIWLLLCLSFSSCLIKDSEVQGIYVTGDYTVVLRHWLNPSNRDAFFIANYPDSSAIAYPAFLLELRKNKQYAVFHIQEKEGSRKIFYYSLQPNFLEDSRKIEVKDLKMISAKSIVAGVELIDPDETKSVILNGTLNK
ncbi:hypothetical protein [Raineya orbicola]|jgi:hypothetical protein|uniref:Lipoprotein n=1 Tax=Raineya orbicola TaxID=2016530 RepID=A0A2N3IJP3_9BACT|nr:hypothetical protein [Raineya orbicola]PKQ70545.1 hypothetical protein Rain11_0465 [Raineya orbicola]